MIVEWFLRKSSAQVLTLIRLCSMKSFLFQITNFDKHWGSQAWKGPHVLSPVLPLSLPSSTNYAVKKERKIYKNMHNLSKAQTSVRRYFHVCFQVSKLFYEKIVTCTIPKVPIKCWFTLFWSSYKIMFHHTLLRDLIHYFHFLLSSFCY